MKNYKKNNTIYLRFLFVRLHARFRIVRLRLVRLRLVRLRFVRLRIVRFLVVVRWLFPSCFGLGRSCAISRVTRLHMGHIIGCPVLRL